MHNDFAGTRAGLMINVVVRFAGQLLEFEANGISPFFGAILGDFRREGKEFTSAFLPKAISYLGVTRGKCERSKEGDDDGIGNAMVIGTERDLWSRSLHVVSSFSTIIEVSSHSLALA
jgi:hypothetical protein